MSENYKNPPLAAGYSELSGSWDTGFVIRRDKDGSEFVWIPVGALTPDAEFAGEKSSFGYRPYGYSGTTKAEPGGTLTAQAENVARDGGFYISRYCISIGNDGALQSAAGAVPLTNINKFEADRQARAFCSDGAVTSHLPYAPEMDSALAWLIQNGLDTPERIANAAVIRNTRAHSGGITAAGADPSLYRLGLYDLAGAVDEWIWEQTDGAYLWGCNPCAWPTTSRCYFAPYACYSYSGFRVALLLG
ncbi:MAG: hypothetical protein ACI3VB_07405 [Oscillospiraceae bacterium]